MLFVEVHDDFTVGMSLEVVFPSERFTESDVVVDFTIDGEDDFAVFADERLGAGVWEGA